VKAGRIFSKLWLPVVVLVVIAIVGYGVNAVHHMSDAITNPAAKSSIPATLVQINPKNVTYEVFGFERVTTQTVGGGVDLLVNCVGGNEHEVCRAGLNDVLQAVAPPVSGGALQHVQDCLLIAVVVRTGRCAG
jgi:hypothetical protein